MGVLSKKMSNGTMIQAIIDVRQNVLGMGLLDGAMAVNKYGRANAGVDASKSDIWDRADVSDTQKIWLPPTDARIHAIKSSSVADDIAGTGARTIKIYGLTAWDVEESSETIEMDGTTNVNTANSYVIIHRMKLITWGTGGTNAGNITATAATDTTITAQINIAEGQTQMAIYGVPEGKTALMSSYYASVIKASSSIGVQLSLLVNTYPNVITTGYIVKHTQGLTSEGTNYLSHDFFTPMRITGPAIIKMQAISSAANTDVNAGFNIIVVDNG